METLKAPKIHCAHYGPTHMGAFQGKYTCVCSLMLIIITKHYKQTISIQIMIQCISYMQTLCTYIFFRYQIMSSVAHANAYSLTIIMLMVKEPLKQPPLRLLSMVVTYYVRNSSLCDVIKGKP